MQLHANIIMKFEERPIYRAHDPSYEGTSSVTLDDGCLIVRDHDGSIKRISLPRAELELRIVK